jgi:hypothetical protein
MDPAVMMELDKIQDKIDRGEAVTQADMDSLRAAAQAATDAMGNPLLPAGFDPAVFDAKSGQLQAESALAAAYLDLPSDDGGGRLFNPDGSGDVFSDPSLPEGDMVFADNGSIVVGTGGEGEISMVSMPVADLLGISVGVGEPVPEAPGDVTKRVKDGVLIMNPVENGTALEYVVANTNYKMEPSFTQHLPAGRTWVIEFDRGEGKGTAKYTLSDGTYAFGSSDNGWELFKWTLSVVLDNGGNDSEFHYNVDNTQAVLAAGESKTHTSAYPIFLRFDRGNGKESQKMVVARKAFYNVGVDPGDGMWEMFVAADEGAIASTESADPAAGGERQSPRGSTGDPKLRAARMRAIMLQAAKKKAKE